MDREMRRKLRCMKAEMKKVKVEAYECLSRDREKVKHEFHIRKMQTSVIKRSKGASRYLRMCLCLDWKE